MFRCQQCGDLLPIRARTDSKFCSGKCRVAAHRAPAPAEMTSAHRWVRWKSITRGGKATKLPLRVDGRVASSTDPSTWAGFKTARAATAGDGVGFVLNGDGVMCLDLDHCLVDGVLSPGARRLLDLVGPTFIEVSPSGDGLHVFGLGQLGRGRRITHDGVSVEAYGTGRYITVTGQRFAGAPARLADMSAVLPLFM